MRWLIASSLLWCAAAGAEPLRVLVVDGFSNHDWRHTTRLIRGILPPEEFAVEVTTSPPPEAPPQDWAAWRPEFSRYAVVIQTCNDIGRNVRWPREVEVALENYVRGGGGLYVFHSGNNAFPAWPEYNRMIGLGWRGKDFGPALRIDDQGQVVVIPAGQGPGTSHGARTDRIINRLGDHPIHAGLPRRWKTPLIEVYTYARGPAEDLTVLSWAEDPATGVRWPIEWVVNYGRGRVYSATFGHVWAGETDPVNLRCAGFQTVFARALQWLAKRAVTHAIPPDFPGENAAVLRPLTLPAADSSRVWEKVEITLRARNQHDNPYTDLLVWVDLKGPGFNRRCYGFWDGGDIFRVRVLATAPGTWDWESGSQPADPGLAGMRGSFTAGEWTEAEKRDNPCRRGMIQPTANGHAFEYADGTPYFLLGDTWWAAPTFRFRWRDDDQRRPPGPDAGFKDFVAYRRQQQFNCVAILAALPNWNNDDKDAGLKMEDGTVLRSAWRQAGTSSAKAMTNEAGQGAFLFPGKVPGFESYFPDVQRLNPAYFQALDRKIDYLNAQGFVPFIEVSRRDIGQAWKKYYPWPDSYTRYVQYVWSRYQANLCLFSPVHLDSSQQTIPSADWNLAANRVIERYGPPPFGTLAGTNPDGSSLHNWGHVDSARWLGFHQIGNRRTHDCYALLTEIFEAKPPVPALNGEPYYDGMENAEGGTTVSARYCRSAMYGSVLSGGLGGHIYGAGGWGGGIWSGEVEAASPHPMWKQFLWPSGDQMRHLKTFILSEGRRYQDLIPALSQLTPNQTGKPRSLLGWAYCARTAERDLFLAYFEQDCPQASLSGARVDGRYQGAWFNPRDGTWSQEAAPFVADAAGLIALPPFPGGKNKSDDDWALKLKLITKP